jgi:hypothetical protein
MIRREAFQASVRRLSKTGFKILLDIIASSPRPLRVKEIPFHFRERHSGQSKLDTLVGLEYLMLLADKMVGHIIPIRFLLFAVIGGIGVPIHLALLWLCLNPMRLSFAVSQTMADNGNRDCHDRHGYYFKPRGRFGSPVCPVRSDCGPNGRGIGASLLAHPTIGEPDAGVIAPLSISTGSQRK